MDYSPQPVKECWILIVISWSGNTFLCYLLYSSRPNGEVVGLLVFSHLPLEPMINITLDYLQPIGFFPAIIILFHSIKILRLRPASIEKVINMGNGRAKYVLDYLDDILNSRFNNKAKRAVATSVLIIGSTVFSFSDCYSCSYIYMVSLK